MEINNEKDNSLNSITKDPIKMYEYIQNFMENDFLPELKKSVKNMKKDNKDIPDEVIANLFVSKMLNKSFDDDDVSFVNQFHSMTVYANVLEALDFNKYLELCRLYPLIPVIKMCVFRGYANHWIKTK